jgi:probable rRNA maturation factor
MMKREIAISNRHSRVKVSSASVKRILQALDRLKGYDCPEGQLSVVFVDDAEIIRLHREFLEDPTVTDVITFVGEPHPVEPFAGEICINVDQAKRAAKEHQHTLAQELRLYLTHGWLHLTGEKDETKPQVASMRVAESVALAYLEQLKLRLRLTV